MSGDAEPWECRQGWEDIRPIAQDDGPSPLVPIAYSAAYRNAMDAFRYLVSVNESSERTIELTEAIVKMNPGHYSVWAYRSETLIAVKADLSKELDMMDELVQQHLKGYQVWQHRRTIVLALNDPSRELGFVSKALAIDSKNYHTWAYRQWVLCHFHGRDAKPRSGGPDNEAVWQGELDFIDSLLNDDVRNNSAWNHRFFVVFESGALPGDHADSELRYTEEKLRLVPNNASAWNYLRGVLRRASKPFSSCQPLIDDLLKASPPPTLAVEFAADTLAASTEQAKKSEAIRLYDDLREKHDPIRAAYWQHRARQVSVA